MKMAEKPSDDPKFPTFQMEDFVSPHTINQTNAMEDLIDSHNMHVPAM